MACAQIPDLPLDQFGRDVVNKWIENRVPLSGTMELDLRCNLRCLHCYRDGEWPTGLLTTAEIRSILDQIAKAGTIWLLFTGGEIFLRPDFFEIYRHARDLGFLVTLFTNGTMITERIADRLRDEPPEMVEISLYGFTRETYEAVTGIPGSHVKCYRGVELLSERSIPLKLKTVAMRTNRHELIDMARFAESKGLRFKFDTMINPNFDRSLVPCNVRLSPEEAVEVDFSLPERLEEYRRYFEPRKDYQSSRLFSCGAGSRTGLSSLRKRKDHRANERSSPYLHLRVPPCAVDRSGGCSSWDLHIPSSLFLATAALAPSFPVAVVFFLLREGLVEMDVPTRQSYVMAVVRPEERVAASGVTHLARMGAWAVAPSFAGLLTEETSMSVPILIGAGMKISYDLLLYGAFRRVQPPEETL